jgi:hypothetical protein
LGLLSFEFFIYFHNHFFGEGERAREEKKMEGKKLTPPPQKTNLTKHARKK